jgi:hypothetical protein
VFHVNRVDHFTVSVGLACLIVADHLFARVISNALFYEDSSCIG